MYVVEYSDGQREAINGALAKRLLIKEAREKARLFGSDTFTIIKGRDRIVVAMQPTEVKSEKG